MLSAIPNTLDRNVNIVNYKFGCYCSDGCSVLNMGLVSFPYIKSMFPLSCTFQLYIFILLIGFIQKMDINFEWT